MNLSAPAPFLSAPFKLGLSLAVCGLGFAPAFSSRAQAEGSADAPRVLIVPAQPEISVGGDCNNASVWVKDQLRVYASPYPLNGFPGGAAWYTYGSTVQNLSGTTGVNPDRSILSRHLPSAASGPWFESVIADHEGNLFAYYHGEYITPDGLKIHPRIGSQISRDGGTTWQDLGLLVDTPAGTDEPATHLQYGFDGGNGDCSAILDQTGTYLYLFFSQYGSSAENQGVGVARMLWSDRAAPAGKVMKWHEGAWSEPALGGQATPVLNNVGDAHELRGTCDFWWGPSIHWNTHLQRYVIFLNRANTTGFTASGIPSNWYLTGASLADPTSWTAPQALSFPDGFNGGWYPQVIGVDHLQTDRLAGRVARLLVSGYSKWKVYFLLPDERSPLAGENAAPIVAAPVSNQNAVVNLPFSSVLSWGTFSDPDGDPLTWLASGLPSWLSFNSVTHQLTGTPTSADVGKTYSVTVGASDPAGLSVSTRFILTVTPPGAVTASSASSDLRPKLQLTVGSGASDLEVVQGTTLSITGRATDVNGDMSEHWLEVQNPTGAWSWQGWLTGDAWNGKLTGSGFESVKSTPFTFSDVGDYYVRTTAIDPDGDWVISSAVHVRVGATVYPSVQVSVNGGANDLTVIRGEQVAIAGRATDHEGDLGEHWLEIQNPEGAWSWEGWLTGEPWAGALGGDSSISAKSGFYTFDRAGVYTVRSTAIDGNGQWIISSVVKVTVLDL